MNLFYNQSVSSLVRKRYSCRTYANRDFDASLRKELVEAATSLTRGLLGERARFQLVDKPPVPGLKFADYGLISGARFFFVGGVSRSERALESYAFLLEHLVLKATDLGLDTCWVGYFHSEYFRDVPIQEGEIRPSVVVVGHGAEKKRFRDRIIRASIRASNRKGWKDVFFEKGFETPLEEPAAGPWAGPLELVRLAPSSGNTQPWRVVKEPGQPVFHFFLKKVKKAYALRGLHRVDIGIAMSHFQLGCDEAGLSGSWLVSNPEFPLGGADIEYRWTWRGA